MTFTVPIAVRGYELDLNGHVNQAVYLHYAEHARWMLLKAAGITSEKLVAGGIGPVTLQNTIKYFRELRDADEMTVSCAYTWNSGKTYTIEQEIRTLDNSVAATVTAICGMLDLNVRKLLADPGPRLAALAESPALLGL